MPEWICDQNLLGCSFGSQASLLRIQTDAITAGSRAPASIMAFIPILNIQPFGHCGSPSSPRPPDPAGPEPLCIPVIEKPWTQESLSIMANGVPVISSASRLHCVKGGLISPLPPFPGSVQIP